MCPRLLPLLLPLLLLTGCAERTGEPADPSMVSLYCDLALAAGADGPAAPDSVRSAIHTRHGITRQELGDALLAYRKDPNRWIGFFSAVVDSLEARSIR